jgi:hypothetical protein
MSLSCFTFVLCVQKRGGERESEERSCALSWVWLSVNLLVGRNERMMMIQWTVKRGSKRCGTTNFLWAFWHTLSRTQRGIERDFYIFLSASSSTRERERERARSIHYRIVPCAFVIEHWNVTFICARPSRKISHHPKGLSHDDRVSMFYFQFRSLRVDLVQILLLLFGSYCHTQTHSHVSVCWYLAI